PPPNDDLYRFLLTAHKESLAKDQATVKTCFDILSAVTPAERDRFARFTYRALAKFLGPAVDGARGEVDAAHAVQGSTPYRGLAAAVVGRAKDAGSLEPLKQLVALIVNQKRMGPDDAAVPAALALIDATEGGAAARKLLELGDAVIPEVKEGCFFALAKSSAPDDQKALADWARKPDEKVRELVARGVGYAVRSPGGASGAASGLVDRFRVDPSWAVRAEGALAALELGHDAGPLLDGALAMDPTDHHLVEKLRAGTLHLIATGEWGDQTTLFLDLCRQWEKLAKERAKLDARPGMSLGRVREVIRTARANSRK